MGFMTDRSCAKADVFLYPVVPLYECYHGVGTNVITILQMGMLRLTEFKALAQVHWCVAELGMRPRFVSSQRLRYFLYTCLLRLQEEVVIISMFASKTASKLLILGGAPLFTSSPESSIAFPRSFGRNSVHCERRLMRSFEQLSDMGGGSGELGGRRCQV